MPTGGIVGELLGPAGSGKTTLLRELARRDPRIVSGPTPTRLQLLPHYLRHLAQLLPAGLCNPSGALAFQEREARAMAYVRAWLQPSGRLAAREHTVLLDHGPIFRLAFLEEFGTALTRSPGFRRWWERSLQLWERRLGLVIHLDAPDALLIERVRGREVGHAIKSKSSFDANLFLRRYRGAFEAVMNRFGPGRPPVICFDTSKHGVDEIADQVIEALEGSGAAA